MRTISIFSVLSVVTFGCADDFGQTPEAPGDNSGDSMIAPVGGCEYTENIVSMDTEMGDGFTAQDVVDRTEGTYENTLQWDASGETSELTMALQFTEDSAVWREGTYYDADGVVDPDQTCRGEFVLVATLNFETDDGKFFEELDLDVRSPTGDYGRVDHRVDASQIEGTFGAELPSDAAVELAINLSQGASAGEIAVDMGDGMSDFARW